MKTQNNKESGKTRGFIHYTDLGLRFALSILVGTYAGYWIDSRLSTLPLFLILGALLGAAGGFYTLYRAAFPSQKKNNQKKND